MGHLQILAAQFVISKLEVRLRFKLFIFVLVWRGVVASTSQIWHFFIYWRVLVTDIFINCGRFFVMLGQVFGVILVFERYVRQLIGSYPLRYYLCPTWHNGFSQLRWFFKFISILICFIDKVFCVLFRCLNLGGILNIFNTLLLGLIIGCLALVTCVQTSFWHRVAELILILFETWQRWLVMLKLLIRLKIHYKFLILLILSSIFYKLLKF